MVQIFVSGVAHFFVVVSGSKFHEPLAHFFIDIYKIAGGKSCIAIGGAYSIDKEYRLLRGSGWWPDEQPSAAIKDQVESVLSGRGWQVDIVLSHTTPLSLEPREAFLPFIDQSTVDTSTEEWLDGIERRLNYPYWSCFFFIFTN